MVKGREEMRIEVDVRRIIYVASLGQVWMNDFSRLHGHFYESFTPRNRCFGDYLSMLKAGASGRTSFEHMHQGLMCPANAL